MNRIHETFLIPVIRATSVSEALHVSRALVDGGIDCIEITFTVPGAHKVIEELVAEFGDKVLVGAGTVLDEETARTAMLSGAQFVVCPHFDERIIRACRRHGKVAIPGAATPTEILSAWEAGAPAVKLFPASCLGGPGYIKALKGPLPYIPIIPTGGVDLNTCADYIKAGAFAIGVGGDLVNKTFVQRGDWEAITDRAKEYRRIVELAKAKE